MTALAAGTNRLAATLAGRPIDVLLNNAGLFGPKPGAEHDLRQNFGSMDYDIWAAVLRVNLMAPMRMAEVLLPICGKVWQVAQADGIASLDSAPSTTL